MYNIYNTNTLLVNESTHFLYHNTTLGFMPFNNCQVSFYYFLKYKT